MWSKRLTFYFPTVTLRHIAMNRLPMHELLKPIAWLEGTWLTENHGHGKFPTIKPFSYCDEINFTSIGQPMLNYTAQSWHPETKRPMHREVGFLRVIPETNKVSLVVAHNFGVTTIEEGIIEDKSIKLTSTGILRQTEGTKPPAVSQIRREFKLHGDHLQHILYMATTNTPETVEHLNATYVRKCEKSTE